MSRLGSMQFPGVKAIWSAIHKAGPRDDIPPLVRDMHEIKLTLSENEENFSIADVKPPPWEDYWNWYRIMYGPSKGGERTVYIERLSANKPKIPEILRVKIERRGGVQAYWWQRTRIENRPS